MAKETCKYFYANVLFKKANCDTGNIPNHYNRKASNNLTLFRILKYTMKTLQTAL